MTTWKRYLIVLGVFIVASAIAFTYWSYNVSQSSVSDTAQVRIIVTGLGDKLQQVPLIAPAPVLAFAMDKYYSLYVHQDLLTQWKADPMNAPGRLTSSPWPDRIDITGVSKNRDGTYLVNGNIVEMANGPQGAPTIVESIPARFTLTKGLDGWQITGYAKL